MKLALCQHIVGKDVRAVARHNHQFRNLDVSKAELAAAIQMGWAFCAQHKPPRKSENFVASGFLAVDVDNDLRIEDALADSFVQSYAGLLYTTVNHTDDAHRFRIVLELEQPLTDRAQKAEALTGFAFKLKGDQAATDPCRAFFGNPGCSVQIFDRTLPHTELLALIEFGRERVAAARSIQKAGSTARVRSRISIAVDTRVRTASNDVEFLWKLDAGRRVFCPNHVDHSPSAFVVRSRDGKPGISCSACLVTMFPDVATDNGSDSAYLSDDIQSLVDNLRAEGGSGKPPFDDCHVRVVMERHMSDPDAPPELLPKTKAKRRGAA